MEHSEVVSALKRIEEYQKALLTAAERQALPSALRFYTIPEVCRMLGLSERSMRKLVRSGAIATVDVSVSGEKAQYRVTQEAVERFVASRMNNAPAKAPPEPAKAPVPRRRIAIDPSCL